MASYLDDDFLPNLIWQKIWQYRLNDIHQYLLIKRPPIPSYDDITYYDGQVDLKYGYPVFVNLARSLPTWYFIDEEDLLHEENDEADYPSDLDLDL